MGRGSGTGMGPDGAHRRSGGLSEPDHHALRLLALVADDRHSGLVAAGDYGDEEFDMGFLLSDDGETILGREGREVIAQAKAAGLGEAVQAFRLLLAICDGATEEDEEAVEADVEAGLLSRGGDGVDLTPKGLDQVRVELSLLLGEEAAPQSDVVEIPRQRLLLRVIPALLQNAPLDKYGIPERQLPPSGRLRLIEKDGAFGDDIGLHILGAFERAAIEGLMDEVKGASSLYRDQTLRCSDGTAFEVPGRQHD